MTKCHLMLLCAALLLLGGCKHASQGPSLSEYGERSLAGQAARFEQYAQLLASLSPAEAMVRQEAMLNAMRCSLEAGLRHNYSIIYAKKH